MKTSIIVALVTLCGYGATAQITVEANNYKQTYSKVTPGKKQVTAPQKSTAKGKVKKVKAPAVMPDKGLVNHRIVRPYKLMRKKGASPTGFQNNRVAQGKQLPETRAEIKDKKAYNKIHKAGLPIL